MRPKRVVVFVDEANGDVDNIPSDGDGLDGNDDTSDEESDADSDVSASPSIIMYILELYCGAEKNILSRPLQRFLIEIYMSGLGGTRQ